MYIEDIKGVCESSGGRKDEREEIFSVVASGVGIGLSDSKRVLVGAGARALFYPTLLYNVVRNKFQAEFRWWDQIEEFLLLGAVPFPTDVKRLKDLGVHGVITLNEPYETLVPTSLYKAHGIDHLVLPTRDYLFAPSIDDISEAVNFIHGKTVAKQGTYVHCKAGRGRSTTIVICYLVEHRHMSPGAAYAYVRSIRPRVLLASAQRQAVEEYYHLKVKKTQQGSRQDMVVSRGVGLLADVLFRFDDGSVVVITKADVDGYNDDAGSDVNLVWRVRVAGQAALARLSSLLWLNTNMSPSTLSRLVSSRRNKYFKSVSINIHLC
ncbi:hypothetical protein L2E82_40905 [Cichorium intybus]|uniref:Uncharacterized protein n=1 Tax=Cichorium intybus TaxID=13427 RepID=A0ACB9AN76_CICIN|nr:hypothetical protein L2E82_40905 [Cichorium intybus]